MANPIAVATPLIKIVIVILLVAVLASLVSGLVFLFKDSDLPGSKRTLHSLGVRVTLAAALLATIFYGFMTGELKMGQSAPWHDRATAPADVVD